ncbi:MAG: dUTP diphosphatase [Chloroflexi bacterium]|nr:dUTP diphosphatase [Chloroflexota bacterium]
MRVYRKRRLRELGIEFQAPRAGDAGYDIRAIAECCVAPGQRVLLETGLHLEIPAGHVGLVKDRSSVAAAGLHALAGVVDSSYRGELKVLLINLSEAAYEIHVGQKIAQLLVVPVYSRTVESVDSLADLSDSERGAGGFGSTDECAAAGSSAGAGGKS